MEVVVFEKPCLILEAAELVYAMVNRIPAARLTEDAPVSYTHLTLPTK